MRTSGIIRSSVKVITVEFIIQDNTAINLMMGPHANVKGSPLHPFLGKGP